MDVIDERLRELEMELLQPAVRRDTERLSLLLAEEFREFGSSGRLFTKSDVIEALRTEAAVEFSIVDFQTSILSEGAALVTYRAVRRDGATEVVSLRSSVWVSRDGRWQMIFHQGTKVDNRIL